MTAVFDVCSHRGLAISSAVLRIRCFRYLILFAGLCAPVNGDVLGLLPPAERDVRPSLLDEDLGPALPEAAKPKGEKIDITTAEGPFMTEVDLRPPTLPLDGFYDEPEPSWMDRVLEDHLLIYQEVPSGSELVARSGTQFGVTTLGFKFDVVGKGPIWVTGNFGWNFLSGPGTAAVAPQTYDLGINFNYAKKLSDVWGVQASVSPLLATDFSNNTRDAFRLLAGGLVTFQADEVTKLVAGVTYLDRPDLNFLPIAGLKWMVTDNLQMDILIPRPRVAWRIENGDGMERWLFMQGEVGGGSWAIDRENRISDRMGYRDFRLTGGVELRQFDAGSSVLEAGYVFHRRIQFERGPGDINPGGTFLIRWGQLY